MTIFFLQKINAIVYVFSNIIILIAFVTYSGCHKIVEQVCQFISDYITMKIGTLMTFKMVT